MFGYQGGRNASSLQCFQIGRGAVLQYCEGIQASYAVLHLCGVWDTQVPHRQTWLAWQLQSNQVALLHDEKAHAVMHCRL